MPSKGNLASLQAYVQALRAVGKGGARRVSRALSNKAKALVDEGFARGMAPNGAAWAPLKVRSGQPLRDTRQLQNSTLPVDAGRGFRISSAVHHGDVHQRGATIQAKGRTLYSRKLNMAFGKSVTISARPFLPREGNLPARWQTGLDEAAREAIARMLKGAGG